MPRFYIQIDDDDHVYRDDQGIELDRPCEARTEVLKAFADMARDLIQNGDRRIFTAAVRDEDDRVIYMASLTLLGQWLVDNR